jgi:hypothetical protein
MGNASVIEVDPGAVPLRRPTWGLVLLVLMPALPAQRQL